MIIIPEKILISLEYFIIRLKGSLDAKNAISNNDTENPTANNNIFSVL